MGCRPEAIDLFIKHRIMYGPGKAVNAGGVATSGLEMTQNAMHISWSAEEVDAKLHQIMSDIHHQCVKYGTEKDGYINLNVKVNPEWRDFWRSAYDAVIAGYHQNKEYWNTIILDGSIPDKDIKRMIAESYDIITDSPTKRIYEAVKRIPKGHVATYGKVAEMAGNAKMSRAVGNALHKNPDPEHIPCFRVVNAKGELAGAFAFGGERTQAKLLEEDGVEVIDGKVDLKKYGI